MSLEVLIGLVLGSSVLGALISSAFTRRSAKESNEIQLLDRAYKEINRLDDRVEELKEVAKELRIELSNKDDLYRRTEQERKRLVKQLDETLWELDETKKELEEAKKRLKGG